MSDVIYQISNIIYHIYIYHISYIIYHISYIIPFCLYYAYVCSFSPARPLSMAQSQIYRIPAQCPVRGTTTAPLEVWQNWHRREDLRIPASLRTSQQAFSPLHQPRVATGQFPHRTSHVDMGQFGVTSLAVDGQNPALYSSYGKYTMIYRIAMEGGAWLCLSLQYILALTGFNSLLRYLFQFPAARNLCTTLLKFSIALHWVHHTMTLSFPLGSPELSQSPGDCPAKKKRWRIQALTMFKRLFYEGDGHSIRYKIFIL